MDGTNNTSPGGLGAVPQRLAGLLELVSTLDLKIAGALSALEEMQRSVAAFEPVTTQADRFIADAQQRVALVDERLERLDERIHRDLDELKAAVMAKIDEIDLGAFGPRLDRLEEAVLNIERATMSFDQAIEGALEVMPGFLSKRIKGEGKDNAPDPDLGGPRKR